MDRTAAPGSPNALRQANAKLLLGALSGRTLSQAELARATGLSPATVSNLVRELSRAGRLSVTDGVIGGRRVRQVGLAAHNAVAVGVEIQEGRLGAVLAGEDGAVLAETSAAWPAQADLERSADVLAAVIDRLLHESAARADDGRALPLTGVGIAVPGFVDLDADAVLGNPEGVPRWTGPVTAELGKHLGRPVHVENDANLAAVAELLWGAGQRRRHFTYVKLADGVGGGVIADGRLFRGAFGGAGEVGHISVDERGPMCQCGNRGCLELFASVPAVLDLLQHRDAEGNPLTVEGVTDLARQGDPRCRRALADAGRAVGLAVGNLVQVLSPELIVIGGVMADPDGPLLEQARHTMIHTNLPPQYVSRLAPPVVAGALGRRASVLGAAALGIRGPVILRGAQLVP